MFYKSIFFFFILSFVGCQFEPVYNNQNIISELCSIKVKNIKSTAQIYEINFKNNLEYILSDKKPNETTYILDWRIERSFKELIKSESNFTRRFEESLQVTFSISDASNNTIYTDSIVSKGAYNILEDEIISTKASKESLNADISINAAKFVLDKIYLFMRKQ